MADRLESECAVPSSSVTQSAAPDDHEQLDLAGQTILGLLHKAAGVAEANSRHALEMAEKLSNQLRAAETRIAELQAEVQLYKDRADRSEQWLHRIYTEIEEQLIRQPEEKKRRILGA
jgi:hypothetical protein